MPTYEYECERCGYRFERFQSITDEPCKRCPKCRCKVKRLVGSGAGIIFKGSGFYATDYRSPTYQAGKRKEKAESSSDSGKKKSGDGSSSSKSSDKSVSSGSK